MSETLGQPIEYPGRRVDLTPAAFTAEERESFEIESEEIISAQGEPRDENGDEFLIARSVGGNLCDPTQVLTSEELRNRNIALNSLANARSRDSLRMTTKSVD